MQKSQELDKGAMPGPKLRNPAGLTYTGPCLGDNCVLNLGHSYDYPTLGQFWLTQVRPCRWLPSIGPILADHAFAIQRRVKISPKLGSVALVIPVETHPWDGPG